MSAARVLRIILDRRFDVDDGEWEGTTMEFLEENQELDDCEIDALLSLSIQQELVIGGGAFATFTIRRVA